MLEKKELNSIHPMFPSEQQLHDLNTKGRFCIFPDMPVDAADKVIPSQISTSSQGDMLKVDDEVGNSLSSATTSAGSNPNSIFGSKPENKAWKWGASLEPSPELVDSYAAKKPVGGVITLPVADPFAL